MRRSPRTIDLLDRAVDRQEVGRRRRPLRDERPPRRAADVRARGQEAPERQRIEVVERRHAPHVAAVGRPALLEVGERGRGELGRLAAERPGEVRELVAEPRGEERREPALERERRRVPAAEQRREVQPAEREHGRGLGRAHAHRVPLPVEQRDLAEDLPRADAADLHGALPRHLERGRHGALDDEERLARVAALLPEHLARRHRAPAHHPRQLGQVRLVPPFEERHGREEAGDLALRHRGRASRTRARPGRARRSASSTPAPRASSTRRS